MSDALRTLSDLAEKDDVVARVWEKSRQLIRAVDLLHGVLSNEPEAMNDLLLDAVVLARYELAELVWPDGEL